VICILMLTSLPHISTLSNLLPLFSTHPSQTSLLISTFATAFLDREGHLQQVNQRQWIQLLNAAELGHEDICMYLTSAHDDLGKRFGPYNLTLCHHAAIHGKLSFHKALVQRGVDFDVTGENGFTPLYVAIKMCHLPVVRFLFEQYSARGREAQDVLRNF